MIENKPPKVGFVTIFGNLGETRTLVEIAKEYKELSGEVVFIGYGSRYERLAEDVGFKVIRIKLKTSEKKHKEVKERRYKYHYKKAPPERVFF